MAADAGTFDFLISIQYFELDLEGALAEALSAKAAAAAPGGPERHRARHIARVIRVPNAPIAIKKSRALPDSVTH